MRTLRSALAFAALVVLTAAAAHAAERGWKLLGERTVSDGLDHDRIVVTASEGDLKALQVRVKGHAVQFRSMKVQFANGAVQEIELRDVIRAGGASRVLDLEGGDRVVQSVEFWYDAQTIRGKRAVVRLFGKR